MVDIIYKIVEEFNENSKSIFIVDDYACLLAIPTFSMVNKQVFIEIPMTKFYLFIMNQ